MRSRLIFGLVFVLGLGARAEAAGTLVVCTEANPDALNSQLSTANTAFDVTEQFADRLVGMKTGGSELVPGLAESWSISEDGLIYTFKLRHDVKWQSNAKFKPTRDFNADDVVFSFQRMMDQQNPFNKSVNGNFPMFADLLSDPVKAVRKTADDTVVFELKHPFAPLLSTLTMQPMSIVSAEYAAQLEKSGDLHDLDTNPIGTGPFTLVAYQKDTMIRFRAFPDFWGVKAGSDRAPKVDTLLFLITPDASARFAKLRANECQVVRYPNPSDLPAMRADPDLKVQDATIAAMDYITFKADMPPLDDKRVRQALAQAIDLDDLVKVVYQGSGTPTAAMVPPTLFGHDPNVKPRPYDPEGAKKLLAEAGHPGGGFKVDLWAIPVVRAYMPNGKRAAEMIQADWAKIGVTANIVTYEWGEYLKRARAGEGEVVMFGGTWDYPDPSEQLLRFTCDAIKTGGNFNHWCNQAYTDAVNKANLITDIGERAKLYIAAQEAFHDDTAAVLFAEVKAFVPLRKNVTGFKLHFLGGQPFGGVSVGQ
jgi:dipeptide transport system substrate-binding protein